MSDIEPHDLDPHRFIEEVHSFEFWFHAVEGYLSDRPYGHHEGLAEGRTSDAERDQLITVLCNYCVAESTALEAASGMVSFAPNHHSRIFLATQVVDEARHLEVFLHRLDELGVTEPDVEIERRANHALLAFRDRILELVATRDWDAAVFAQNVVLETMEYTVFQAHAEIADPVTAEILEGVISDERRHLGFGENDLGRRLATTPSTRPRIEKLKEELDVLVLHSFDSALSDIGIPLADQPALGRDYLLAVERLGLVS